MLIIYMKSDLIQKMFKFNKVKMYIFSKPSGEISKII